VDLLRELYVAACAIRIEVSTTIDSVRRKRYNAA
jgi:hypothetical protein